MPAEALPELVHFTLPRGTQIAAYVGGPETGTPVVLLHGGGTDHALMSWRKTMPALVDAGYRVFAPNYPGYGASPPDDRITTTDDRSTCWKRCWTSGRCLGCAGRPVDGWRGGARLHPRPPGACQEAGARRAVWYSGQSALPLLELLYLKVPGVLDFSWGLVRNSRSVARMMLNSIIRNRSRTDELRRSAGRHEEPPLAAHISPLAARRGPA